MKKLALITLLAVGGLALAASMNVPWFVDNANAASAVSGKSKGYIALHNNLPTPVTCKITYYAADGTKLNYAANADGSGVINETWEDTTDRQFVWSSSYNTFVITANSTVSFRPVAFDPDGACDIEGVTPNDAGSESNSGVVVPNKPIYGAEEEGPSPAFTSKKNGAAVIEWSGGPTDIQGRYADSTQLGTGMYLLPGGS